MDTRTSLLSSYVQWLTVEKGRSPATIEAYERDILDFLASVDKDPSQVQSEDIERYIEQLRTSRAPSSVARAQSSIRSWWGYLVDEGVVGGDPTRLLKASPRGRTLPKPLSEGVIVGLLDGISGEEPSDLRDRALLEFLYGTGARVSEVVGVRLEDLDFDEELIRLMGKGRKQRLVPMGAGVNTSLRRYLAAARPLLAPRSNHHHVFVNQRGGRLSRQGVDLIIRHRALVAGIDRSTISAHVFRHSCATHMLDHGADIRVVQELLGHASIATTQRYTAVSMATLRNAYQEAHPRSSK